MLNSALFSRPDHKQHAAVLCYKQVEIGNEGELSRYGMELGVWKETRQLPVILPTSVYEMHHSLLVDTAGCCEVQSVPVYRLASHLRFIQPSMSCLDDLLVELCTSITGGLSTVNFAT